MQYHHPNPRMTRYLVETGAFRDNKLVLVDVGAREGVQLRWQVFQDQLTLIGFEPDPVECERLNQLSRNGISMFYPYAVDRQSGQRVFHLTRYSAACGFYDNTALFGRVDNGDNVCVQGTQTIATVTLDEFVEREQIKRIDFIKLDVEGAELDVLKGGQRFLVQSAFLGVEAECRFQKAPAEAAVFGELDAWLRENGLSLFDLDLYRFARRSLPLPYLWDYRDEAGEPVPGPTTAGQVLVGDALFLRDLAVAELHSQPLTREGAQQLLKLACLYEIFGLADCAVELLLKHQAVLESQFPVVPLLDRLTPELIPHAGHEPLTYADYLRHSAIFRAREGRVYDKNLLEWTSVISDSRKPLVVRFEARSESGVLELSPSGPADLPSDRWTPGCPASEMNVVDSPGRKQVTTGSGRWAYALKYPPLRVPVDGFYRLELKYRLRSGNFTFGALDKSNRNWIGQAAGQGVPDSSSQSDPPFLLKRFTLRLQADESFNLLIANNHPDGDFSSEFEVFDARAYLLES